MKPTILLGMLLAALLTACGGSDDSPPTPDANTANTGGGTSTGSTASALIQAAVGGSVRSADGQLTLTIPPGALSQDATVSITTNSSWQLPADMADAYRRVGDQAYDIQTQGGTWVAGTPPQIQFASATPPAAAAASARLQAQALSSSDPRDTWGISGQCPEGDTTIIVLPPPAPGADPYEPQTPLIGCDPPSPHITVSQVHWKQPPSTVAWTHLVSLPQQPFYPPSVGDSWVAGSTPMSMALSPGNPGAVILVDGAGQRLPASTLPSDPLAGSGSQEAMRWTKVVMDGPAHFYATGQHEQYALFHPPSDPTRDVWALAYAEQVVASFSLQYSRLLKSFVVKRDWTHVVPGSAACDQAGGSSESGGFQCGGHLFTTAIGLARDPISGDALFAGFREEGQVKNNGPVGADGAYVGRIGRGSGQLAWQTSVPNGSWTNYYLQQSNLYNRLEVDPQGNSYVAAASDSRLYASQISPSGQLNWSVLSLNGAGAQPYNGALASGMDASGQLYLATRLTTGVFKPGMVQLVRVDARTGAGSLAGSFPDSTDLNGQGQPDHLVISPQGKVYVSYATTGPGMPGGTGAYILSEAAGAYKTSDSPVLGALQVDGEGQLLLQQNGSFDSETHPDVCKSTSSLCYGLNLRKFKF
jgi:hypothetical protein